MAKQVNAIEITIPISNREVPELSAEAVKPVGAAIIPDFILDKIAYPQIKLKLTNTGTASLEFFYLLKVVCCAFH